MLKSKSDLKIIIFDNFLGSCALASAIKVKMFDLYQDSEIDAAPQWLW